MQRALTMHTRTGVLREALALMQAEYDTDLTLDELARSPRPAPSCNAASNSTARAASATLTNIRMRRSAEVLLETALPVRVIAVRVGCRQPAQFAKAFTRSHAAPPARWRVDRRVPTSA
jgi:AraC family transcriptional regulator, regulatory protein of adaptative response / methylphosphotriester-DNA alkyltransferase methyltransferase